MKQIKMESNQPYSIYKKSNIFNLKEDKYQDQFLVELQTFDVLLPGGPGKSTSKNFKITNCCILTEHTVDWLNILLIYFLFAGNITFPLSPE